MERSSRSRSSRGRVWSGDRDRSGTGHWRISLPAEEKIHRPSGEKATALTSPSWPSKRWGSSPAKVPTLTKPSESPVTMSRTVGSKATDCTLSPWVLISLRVSASRSKTRSCVWQDHGLDPSIFFRVRRLGIDRAKVLCGGSSISARTHTGPETPRRCRIGRAAKALALIETNGFARDRFHELGVATSSPQFPSRSISGRSLSWAFTTWR